MSEPVRIGVGEGSPEGVNSAYVLPEQRAVIDPGPPTENAWSTLRSGIGETQLAVGNIEHVFVTHWHIDHAGLACRVAERANATVHVHRADSPLIGDYADARKRRLERDDRTLERWGVPDSIRKQVLKRDTPSPLPDSFPVEAHDDGEVVAGVEFVHTPGHTKGHASLRAEGTIYLGDVLLPTYTPNVGGSDTRLSDPLEAYLRSLTRLESMAERGKPGHGSEIEIRGTIDDARRHHRERARASFRALETADRTESTPWQVAQELFGEMRGIHAKFGAGEAAAHLERLAALGIVAAAGRRSENEPIRFSRAVEEYPNDLALL